MCKHEISLNFSGKKVIWQWQTHVPGRYTFIIRIQAQATTLQRSCPQCARRIHRDTSYSKQTNKQKQVEWTFSTFNGRLPGRKSAYRLAGQRGGLDISIVVVVFFHTFIFILFFLFWFRSLENVSPTDLEICSFARHRGRFRSWESYQLPPPHHAIPTLRSRGLAGARSFVARTAFERFALTAWGGILRTLLHHRRSTVFAYLYNVNTTRHGKYMHSPRGAGTSS